MAPWGPRRSPEYYLKPNLYGKWVYTKDDLLRKKWTLLMSKLRSSHDTRRLLRRSVESSDRVRCIQLYPKRV